MTYPAAEQSSIFPPPLVALAGWIVPGAGYWVIGQRARGVVVCVTILLLYVSGLAVAGARVIEVPGYDSQTGRELRTIRGQRIAPADRRTYPGSKWLLTDGGFLSEIASKPWFVGQILAGPVSIGSAVLSISMAQAGYSRPHAPLESVGTLYTAVAGMLNLLVIIDSAYRAGNPSNDEDALKSGSADPLAGAAQ